MRMLVACQDSTVAKPDEGKPTQAEDPKDKLPSNRDLVDSI